MDLRSVIGLLRLNPAVTRGVDLSIFGIFRAGAVPKRFSV
jgi:hypothetical protein